MSQGRRALLLLLGIVLGGALAIAAARPASAAPARSITGPACTGYQFERRGADLVVTCAGAPARYTWLTVVDWYGRCAWHFVVPQATGVQLVCVVPILRRS